MKEVISVNNALLVLGAVIFGVSALGTGAFLGLAVLEVITTTGSLDLNLIYKKHVLRSWISLVVCAGSFGFASVMASLAHRFSFWLFILGLIWLVICLIFQAITLVMIRDEVYP